MMSSMCQALRGRGFSKIFMPTEFTNVRRVKPQTLSRTTDFTKRALMKTVPVKLVPESWINSQFRLVIGPMRLRQIQAGIVENS
jgi:hypothetical protein